MVNSITTLEITQSEALPTKNNIKNSNISLNIVLISFAAFIWSIFLSIQGQYLNDDIANLISYTPLKISLMISLVALTGAIASIIFGSISDNLRIKFGRRKLFILTGGVSSALLFFLLPISDVIIYIIGINVILNILNSIAFVCNNSFIPDITNKTNLGKINSLASLGTSLGTIAGFALMLIKSSSTVYFVSGAICAFGFLIVGLFIQEPKITTKPKKWHKDLLSTFTPSSLKEENSFISFLISHFLLHSGINVYIPFLLIFLTQENDPLADTLGLGLSIENGEVLIVFAVMTVISILSSLPFGFLIDRVNTSNFLIFSRIIFAITTGFLAFTPMLRSISALVAAILFIIPYSIANTADMVSRGALMHSLVPKNKKAQFLGYTVFAKIIAQIPGVIIGGLLAQFNKNGYQLGFLVGGLIVLLSVPFIVYIQYNEFFQKIINKIRIKIKTISHT